MENEKSGEELVKEMWNELLSGRDYKKHELPPIFLGAEAYAKLQEMLWKEAVNNGFNGIVIYTTRQDRAERAWMMFRIVRQLIQEGRNVAVFSPDELPDFYHTKNGIIPNLTKAEKDFGIDDGYYSTKAGLTKMFTSHTLVDDYGLLLNNLSSDDITVIDSANRMLDLVKSKTVEQMKIEDDLAYEREYRKQEPKQMNKDRHFNPNRVHANSHSSKTNNRERSRKKRKSKNKKK